MCSRAKFWHGRFIIYNAAYFSNSIRAANVACLMKKNFLSKDMKLKCLIPLMIIVVLTLAGAALSVSAKTIDAEPASTKSLVDDSIC